MYCIDTLGVPESSHEGKFIPMWQFWDSGGVKLESLCNFSIVGCQWTVNCLLGIYCLGHSHYILCSTDTDRGFLGDVGGKKRKNLLAGSCRENKNNPFGNVEGKNK